MEHAAVQPGRGAAGGHPHIITSQPRTSVQDWRTTALDGCVLDHLGKLVNEGKLDPV